MIVTYRTRDFVLFTRPQTGYPAQGEHVVLTPEGGEGQRYRVVAVEWPVRMPPRQYHSITDEADVQVHVVLELCRGAKEAP